MISLFKTEDSRVRLHFSATSPSEPDFEVSDLHATWLKIQLNPHLDSAHTTAILGVTWKVDPPDATGWSIALVEADDEELRSKHIISRVDCTAPVGGIMRAELPLTNRVGLPYQAILLYHIATTTDVKVNDVAIEVTEVVDDKG